MIQANSVQAEKKMVLKTSDKELNILPIFSLQNGFMLMSCLKSFFSICAKLGGPLIDRFFKNLPFLMQSYEGVSL